MNKRLQKIMRQHRAGLGKLATTTIGKLAKAGLKEDAVVTADGQEYRIVFVVLNYSKLWLVTNPRNKNGSWSVTWKNIYVFDELKK